MQNKKENYIKGFIRIGDQEAGKIDGGSRENSG